MSKVVNPPKGCRDFGPEELEKREYIISVIKAVFTLYGFRPLATPAIENIEVLTGKYGDEGDQLLFKILNSGDFTKNINLNDLSDNQKTSEDILKLANAITDKGLKYDLTVPFARYIAKERHNLTFPFKRYQIQPVWRADRPQKGRYREFYQCDIDVIGSSSLIHEAELIAIANSVFKKLRLPEFKIHLNHRGILQGLCDYFGINKHFSTFCVGIDKLIKIGINKVVNEWEKKGIDKTTITRIIDFISNVDCTFLNIKNIFEKHEIKTGLKAIEEIEQIYSYCKYLGMNSINNNEIENVPFTPFLARGLSYYTGAIYEITLHGSGVGSVAAGGRYDNLTAQFGIKDLTGVGLSFGVDRIFDVLMTKNLFPNIEGTTTKVLVFGFEKQYESHCLKIINQLRENNIASEIYTLKLKLQKALNFANKKGIPFVILIGDEEHKKNYYTVKNMVTGEQHKLNNNKIISFLK